VIHARARGLVETGTLRMVPLRLALLPLWRLALLALCLALLALCLALIDTTKDTWQDGSEVDTWALQSKVPRPHKGLMFRYLEDAKNDGRVLPMSMVVVEGHSANVVEYKHDALERKLLSMSKGGSNNQRLLSAEQKKGLVPGGRANAASRALPASVRKGTGINVHNRLLAASKPKTPTSQWDKKGKAAKRPGDAHSSPSKPKAEMSFLDSLNSY